MVLNDGLKPDTWGCIQTLCYPGRVIKPSELGSCKGQWPGVTLELVANVYAVACMELRTVWPLFLTPGVPLSGRCEDVFRLDGESSLLYGFLEECLDGVWGLGLGQIGWTLTLRRKGDIPGKPSGHFPQCLAL